MLIYKNKSSKKMQGNLLHMTKDFTTPAMNTADHTALKGFYMTVKEPSSAWQNSTQALTIVTICSTDTKLQTKSHRLVLALDICGGTWLT